MCADRRDNYSKTARHQDFLTAPTGGSSAVNEGDPSEESSIGLERLKRGRRRAHALLGAFALPAMALVANPAWAINHGWGYVWANQPTTASYAPASNYQSNSSYATNTITRTGVGAYTVNFPNLDALGGTVLVTTYGWGKKTCKVASWYLWMADCYLSEPNSHLESLAADGGLPYPIAA